MTEKEKIRALIERRRIAWLYGVSVEAKFKCEECKDILESIDSLQEEPVSEELEKASIIHSEIVRNTSVIDEDFIAGAQWQKQQMMR